MTKICTKCGEEKPLEEFHKGSPRNKFGRAAYCKPCENKRTRDYRKDNRDKMDSIQRKYRYGITLEEYNELLEQQNYKCAICQRTQEETTDKRGHFRLAVDHCHETGKVRGLLCYPCNVGLGYFQDNIEILEEAVKYLDGRN